MSAAVASRPVLLFPSAVDNAADSHSSNMTFATNLQHHNVQDFLVNPIVFREAEDPSMSIVPTTKMEFMDDTKLTSSSTPTSQKNGTTSLELAPSPKIKSPKVSNTTTKAKSLWTGELTHTWTPGASPIARGLDNNGNTCFLNSVLQCLFHTPSLVNIVAKHHREDCKSGGFCMSCEFRVVAISALGNNARRASVNPRNITGNLKQFAKSLRLGRQEDAHEFLRYSIDAFQKSALFGTDPKLPHNIKETTWVHKIFGGRLRSRVTCRECKHPSDTFDSLLDLSLDIRKCASIREALDAFVTVDMLSGANKYRCERCKKAVNAEKQFTIHDAPHVLSLHLKRFTPLGRKVTQPVQYDERLSLAKYMSKGQFGPKYSLYAVISHAGSGPNSGHYYAHVKSQKGTWYEMNDEMVTPAHRAPLGLKSAYILFYMKDQGQFLDAAISAPTLAAPAEIVPASVRAAAIAEKKRKASSEDPEDIGEVQPVGAARKSLSPVFKKPKLNELDGHIPPSLKPDPAGVAIAAKIKTVSASLHMSSALTSLNDYGGESSGPEDINPTSAGKAEKTESAESIPSPPEPSTSSTSSSIPPQSTATSAAIGAPVEVDNFYGKPLQFSSKKSRRSDENQLGHGRRRDQDESRERQIGKWKSPSRKDKRNLNPYSRGALRDNLSDSRDGSLRFSGGGGARSRMRGKHQRPLI